MPAPRVGPSATTLPRRRAAARGRIPSGEAPTTVRVAARIAHQATDRMCERATQSEKKEPILAIARHALGPALRPRGPSGGVPPYAIRGVTRVTAVGGAG